MKKPIFTLRTRSNPFLKVFRLSASMTSCGKLFRLSTTRSEKKYRRRYRRHLCLVILAECPLVFVTVLMVNRSVNDINDCPLKIRKTSSRSARFLLSSSVHNRNLLNRSIYVSCLKTGINRVNLCDCVELIQVVFCLSHNMLTKLIRSIQDGVEPESCTASARYPDSYTIESLQ